MPLAMTRRGAIATLGTVPLFTAGCVRALQEPDNVVVAEYEVIATGLGFPEGPVYMDDGSIVLVELQRETLSRVSPDGAVSVIADLGGGPNGTAIGPDGAFYVANDGGLTWKKKEDGRWTYTGVPADYTGAWIERIDPLTGSVTRLYDSVDGNRLKAANDLVFDHWGGFWFSDTGKVVDRHTENGGLYWGKPDGSEIREMVFPLDAANGIALSLDGKTLYVALMNMRQIVAFNLIGPGELEMDGDRPKVRVVVGLPGALRLDSMRVDGEGNIVIATIGSGEILTIDPSGTVIERVRFDEPLVSSFAFGGSDMRDCYALLAARGDLVKLRWNREGARPFFTA